MARRFLSLLGLAAATSACSTAQPPSELDGLWSAGAAACAAGVGVRFEPRAIEAVYDEEVEILFENPRYEVLPGAGEFRVRVRYSLPQLPGGAHSAGAYGVIILAQQPGGGLAPEAHQMIDARTGAARMRITGDPALALLTLEPCGAHPWREELRGRTQRAEPPTLGDVDGSPGLA